MVERHQRHADKRRQQDHQSVDSEIGDNFLNCRDLQEAIDQFGAVLVQPDIRPHSRQSPGQVGDRAGEQASLQDFRDVEVQRLQAAKEPQQRQHHQAQNDDGLV